MTKFMSFQAILVQDIHDVANVNEKVVGIGTLRLLLLIVILDIVSCQSFSSLCWMLDPLVGFAAPC